MYFIAVAYSELNKREPDCGTTFTWAARAFGPRTGWMGGWGIIAADVIVMANLAQIAGSYGFLLFGLDSLAESTFWTTVAGVLWIVVMTWICYIGLEVSARLQYVLLSVELVVLVAFAVYALVKVYAGDAPDGSLHPVAVLAVARRGLDWSSLDRGPAAGDLHLLGLGHRGRDQRGERRPGHAPRAARPSSPPCCCWAPTPSSPSRRWRSPASAPAGSAWATRTNADDVFNAIGPAVFGDDLGGRIFQALLIISVLTSASASTQTTILPTARATLSMGAYGAIPPRLRPDPPEVPDPVGVDDLDGRGVDRVLRRPDDRQRQRAGRTRSSRSAC